MAVRSRGSPDVEGAITVLFRTAALQGWGQQETHVCPRKPGVQGPAASPPPPPHMAASKGAKWICRQNDTSFNATSDDTMERGASFKGCQPILSPPAATRVGCHPHRLGPVLAGRWLTSQGAPLPLKKTQNKNNNKMNHGLNGNSNLCGSDQLLAQGMARSQCLVTGTAEHPSPWSRKGGRWRGQCNTADVLCARCVGPLLQP